MTHAFPSTVFNVRSFGAKGDGSDDTAAFQAAINAAVASNRQTTLLIPAAKPGSWYAISDTLTIQPSTGTQAWMNIQSAAGFGSILWLGGNNKSFFKVIGLKRSVIQGVDLQINGQSGVTAWDLDTTATLYSTGSIIFQNCQVSLTNTTNGVGWKMGHVSGGVADISAITFISCGVSAETTTGDEADTRGHIGWVNEGANSLAHIYINCSGTGLKKFFTNISTSGATWPTGNNNQYFYGCGSGYNHIVYEFKTAGGYCIHGGRHEHDNIFLNVGGAGTSNSYAISVMGVTSNAMTPGSNRAIMLGTLLGASCFELTLLSNDFTKTGGTVFSSADFMDIQTNTPGFSSVFLSGNRLMASEPIYTVGGTGQAVLDIRPTNVKVGTDNAITGLIESTQPVKEGTRSGVATLVAGTVTVTTVAVATNSRIRLSPQNSSGTAGELTVSARTAGTSFVITSLNAADTRTVFWEIVDPF